MAHHKSSTRALRFATPGTNADGKTWCKGLGHKPRRYGDGIFCENCEIPMTAKQLAAYDARNPKKVFHKRPKYNKPGGTVTVDDYIKDYGLIPRDPR